MKNPFDGVMIGTHECMTEGKRGGSVRTEGQQFSNGQRSWPDGLRGRGTKTCGTYGL